MSTVKKSIFSYRDGCTDIVPIDRQTGEVRNDIDLAEVKRRKMSKLFMIRGEMRDLARKHEYEISNMKTFTDNSLNTRRITTYQATDKETGKIKIYMIVEDSKGKRVKLRYSRKKIYQIMKTWHNLWQFCEPDPTFEHLPMSSETIMYMVLLRSSTNSFYVSDLIDAGIPYGTVRSLVRSMEKKGVIKYTGKNGNAKEYSCTIPQEHLRKMFGQTDVE